MGIPKIFGEAGDTLYESLIILGENKISSFLRALSVDLTASTLERVDNFERNQPIIIYNSILALTAVSLSVLISSYRSSE